MEDKIRRKYLRFKKGEVWITEGIGIEINGEKAVEVISLDKLTDKDFKAVRDTKRIDKVRSKL